MNYTFTNYGTLFLKRNKKFFNSVIIILLLSIPYHVFAAFTTVNIAFRTTTSSPPSGYIAEIGSAYSTTTGRGWINPVTKAPQSMAANMRLRTGSSEARLLGVAQMQSSTTNENLGVFEYAVPNGLYRVVIGVGDDSYFDSDHQLNIEGLPVVADFVPSTSVKHKIATGVVQVSDGKLTIDPNGGINSKMNFIIISDGNTTVTDAAAPTTTMRLVGKVISGTSYDSSVQVFCSATAGASGLKTFQYSINNAAYLAYTQPLTIQGAGNYSVTIKATDADNHQVTSAPITFSIAASASKSTGMVVQNLDNFPSNDHLAFSYLQTPWRRTDPDTTPYNANHDTVKLRIFNRGSGNVIINKLTLSRPAAWKVLSINTDTTLALPITIAPTKSADISIRFLIKNAASRVKIFHDTLSIASNDSISPTKKIMLDGLWQLHGEGLTEPWTQEVFNLYNFTSTTGFNHDDNGLKGSGVVPNSSEVAASYFVQADLSRPIVITEIAQYHGCCKAVTPMAYYLKGASTSKTVFTTNNLDGQSVLPRQIASSLLSKVSVTSISGSFGFLSDYTIYSDPAKNYQGKIGIRFWKAIDANGNMIPNAFLAGTDYLGTPFSNGDYNDDVYYIQNIKPESGTAFYPTLVATPEDVVFPAALTNSSQNFSVNLFNPGHTYPDGSSDPVVTIKSAKISGPNASEFNVGTLSATKVNLLSSVTLGVNFVPKTLGIKNAVLIVDYGNATPLRIPLYGIANTTAQTISVVQRIKAGSDVALKINNQQWISDKPYRTGSIKLDAQTVKTPVSSTTADSLYQTYLSAAADLAVTNLNIPVTNGSYMVRMHFAENYFTAELGRIFSISIENQTVLSAFDIFKEVGYRTALVKDFNATVNDGVLSVKFTPTANRVSIAGIEIFKASATTLMAAKPDVGLTEVKTDSLKSNGNTNKIVVYPNPNTGEVVQLIADSFKPLETVNYSINSLYGVAVKKDTFITDTQGKAQISVALPAKLTKGIYLINFLSGSGSSSSKFIVQ
ncbi:malectin domain-containing carbohydrate-binding protein [Mucilaginibacter agri]|uniref:T9SS type A sorting domain-containing protein n=1 Tax=Mucilaginibacter agri TaxID=2695265 RepID=A0A965ZKL0_9SPHI|nr:malectin domain-containing carbohydrate-binding protein [Mucilaginibacter agri]NCD72410.1 T9SS type A sorting domain-containing protein [Mucilaginibacter agri]